MTQIKICGLSRPADIQIINRVRPEYIGFVFARNSKRKVSPEQAARLRAQLDARICPVGVFVNETVEAVAALVKAGTVQAVQLHGQEDETYIARLRETIEIPIIQAFLIQNTQNIEAARRSTADYILLDSRCAGSGTSFDWSLIQEMDRPYFLAGGLSPDNVREALALKPFAVDVSSGVETAGVKDAGKIQAFVEQVRKER